MTCSSSIGLLICFGFGAKSIATQLCKQNVRMDITDRVIDQIVTQCKEKGFVVMPQLASFMAKGIIMDNRLGFNVDTELNATQLGELVSIAVDKLSQNDSPQLETVKMQVSIMSAKEQMRLDSE